jgi:hypothetical protein
MGEVKNGPIDSSKTWPDMWPAQLVPTYFISPWRCGLQWNRLYFEHTEHEIALCQGIERYFNNHIHNHTCYCCDSSVVKSTWRGPSSGLKHCFANKVWSNLIALVIGGCVCKNFFIIHTYYKALHILVRWHSLCTKSSLMRWKKKPFRAQNLNRWSHRLPDTWVPCNRSSRVQISGACTGR